MTLEKQKSVLHQECIAHVQKYLNHSSKVQQSKDTYGF